MSNKPTEAKAGSEADEQGSDGYSRRSPPQLRPAVVHQMMHRILQGLALLPGVADGSIQLFSATLAALPTCEAIRVPNFSELVAS
jgi:hypothetical protein